MLACEQDACSCHDATAEAHTYTYIQSLHHAHADTSPCTCPHFDPYASLSPPPFPLSHTHPWQEVVLDLGRPPLARFPGGDVRLSEDAISGEDLAQAVSRVSKHGFLLLLSFRLQSTPLSVSWLKIACNKGGKWTWHFQRTLTLSLIASVSRGKLASLIDALVVSLWMVLRRRPKVSCMGEPRMRWSGPFSMS